jgi:hypothetical protein
MMLHQQLEIQLLICSKTNTPNVVTTTDVDTTSGTSSHVNMVLLIKKWVHVL